jgi:hypothetical protein
VRRLCAGLLSVATIGFVLSCVGTVSGCDSKPGDGAVVEDAGHIDADQKARVKGFYAKRAEAENRTKPAKKKK